MTDVYYVDGGRWTITHRAIDYAKAVWKQPRLTFSHRGDWARHCTLCRLDVEELQGHDIGGEG